VRLFCVWAVLYVIRYSETLFITYYIISYLFCYFLQLLFWHSPQSPVPRTTFFFRVQLQMQCVNSDSEVRIGENLSETVLVFGVHCTLFLQEEWSRRQSILRYWVVTWDVLSVGVMDGIVPEDSDCKVHRYFGIVWTYGGQNSRRPKLQYIWNQCANISALCVRRDCYSFVSRRPAHGLGVWSTYLVRQGLQGSSGDIKKIGGFEWTILSEAEYLV
jgi:hypothetical protein